MAQHHSFDVLDGPRASCLNGRRQAMYLFIPCSRRALDGRSRPVRDDIFTTARVEEDQADVRMQDENRDHDHVAPLMLLRWQPWWEQVGP